jgi:enoyl-CoA hydratase/carnithine racemase
MSEGAVRYSEDGTVGRIVFDRPAARNAMTWAMYDELAAICTRLAADRHVRVVVLRGAGGQAFVAGTDIGGFADFTSGEDGLAYEAKMDRIIEAVEALPMPTVAAVEGWAVGGGLAIAAACDFRIATPDARFGAPIARTLGNCFSAANYARLVAALGVARAKRVLLLGEMIGAEEAKAAGFVIEIAEGAAFDAVVETICGRLARNAPLTQMASKEAIRRLTYASLPDIDDLIREVYGSDDFRRGVRAFLTKTTPEWTGK